MSLSSFVLFEWMERLQFLLFRLKLSLLPGGSSAIDRFQIGTCFISNSMPRYPVYFRGVLTLYFSNGQVVDLSLYTDYLRTHVIAAGGTRTKTAVTHYRSACLVNGRKVPADAVLKNVNEQSRIIVRLRAE